MTFDINSTVETASERITGKVDFSAFADEPSQGAWPTGWYFATITPGYQTRKGTEFTTSDVVAKNGESRNLRLCFEVQNGDQKRNIQEQFNYQPDLAFTADGLQQISLARTLYRQGSWPGEHKALQSTSISLGRLGQLQRATGTELESTGDQFDPSPLVGRSLDVRLGIDEKGFNKITEFASPGAGGLKKAGKK